MYCFNFLSVIGEICPDLGHPYTIVNRQHAFGMGVFELCYPKYDIMTATASGALQWRLNGQDGVSNHQSYDCLLNRLFSRRSKKTSKLRVTGLCEGNSSVTGEFPAQNASNAGNVSIWWRHHGRHIYIILKIWDLNNIGAYYKDRMECTYHFPDNILKHKILQNLPIDVWGLNGTKRVICFFSLL